jgi:hypothetical protein
MEMEQNRNFITVELDNLTRWRSTNEYADYLRWVADELENIGGMSWGGSMSYKVEILQENDWIIYSWHKNPEHADINFDVQTKAGKVCRIVYRGQVVREWISIASGGMRGRRKIRVLLVIAGRV